MPRIAAALVSVMLIAACSGSGGELGPSTSSKPTPRSVELSISLEAEAAARDVGVDLDSVVRGAVTEVGQHIEVPPVAIEVDVNPDRAVPERGDGGSSDPGDGAVIISLDPSFNDFRWTLETSLPLTIAHELHHSARVIDGPGYGATLRQAIVTEGLADNFSLEVYPEARRPPWTRALKERSVCRWWHRAEKDFELGRSYDQLAWFFGRGQIPRWTGYTLGFELVSSYLDRHPGESAARLVDVEAATIVEDAGFC